MKLAEYLDLKQTEPYSTLTKQISIALASIARRVIHSTARTQHLQLNTPTTESNSKHRSITRTERLDFLDRMQAVKGDIEAMKQANFQKHHERMRLSIERGKLEREVAEITEKEQLYKKLIVSQIQRIQRQQERSRLKQESELQLRRVQEVKPLYRKYEENYTLKRRSWSKEAQTQLAVKAQEKASYSLDEIELHQQRHNELLELMQMQNARKVREETLTRMGRQMLLSPSKTYEKLSERDRQLKASLLQKSKRSQENLLRRKAYSRVISNLMSDSPTYHLKKRKLTSVRPNTLSPSHKEPKQLKRETSQFKPRKFKPNSMVQEEEKPRKAVFIDYLQERRESRHRALSNIISNKGYLTRSSTDSYTSNLLDISKCLEIRARTGELISHSVKRFSLPMLDYEANLDQLYIDSIKAKLAYFNQAL